MQNLRRTYKRLGKRILRTGNDRFPRKRSGSTISAFERGDRPAPKPVPADLAAVLDGLKQLSQGQWHQSGSLPYNTLEAIVQQVLNLPIPVSHSLETGCGKSTLLLSHLSPDHKVFTIASLKDSLPKVLESPLLNAEAITVVDGPTQLTLPPFKFETKYQLALLDGPHSYPAPDLEYYYVYPHLETGGLLIVDDIHIPCIYNMFEFIAADAMFDLLQIVGNTAFFRRTAHPTFDPVMGNWAEQGYNEFAALKRARRNQ